MSRALFVLSVMAALTAKAELVVDDALPAGNVIVEKIEGDAVYLRQDQRDSEERWIYTKFRVRGAGKRKLVFEFGKNNYAVGSRGPAISIDRGKSWEWLDAFQRQPLDPRTKDHASSHSFTFDFAAFDPSAIDEVWFSQTMPYLPEDWKVFIEAHEKDRGRLFASRVLCTTRKGREVPYVVFGRLDGKAKYRIFVSARHHCQEASASFVLEGLCAQVFADDDLGLWLRENCEIRAVPFVDLDGVVDGDQGKRRRPHDHARDYAEDRERIYPEVDAIMKMLKEWKPTIVNDFHSPWLRGSWFEKDNSNEFIYQVEPPDAPKAVAAIRRFGEIVERTQLAGLDYRQADDFWYGRGWNSGANWTKGMSLAIWSAKYLAGAKLATIFEIPFANARFKTLYPADLRAFGRDIALGYREFLETAELPRCVDGIYPHLVMSNNEGECGTGAVVPWAGKLWVVTYGPHCPVGSSDRLYEIAPDLTRRIRTESVGGTPANRMIHRESNQLFIGSYVIDAKGNVRVIEPRRMPGRLTATARHPSDAAKKVYTATMDNGLYEIDVDTLAVKTLVRDDNGVDGAIWGRPAMRGFPFPQDWWDAIPNKLPGSHTKGMATGFALAFMANNGEYDPRAKTDPWIPSGVLGRYDPVKRMQQVIRRCQFTEVTTKDGIHGNEHPGENPIWALGWDVKSVILAVTDDGKEWRYFRLPKASHAYDGAHGWNTEWPRIREAGLGNGDLLATMHGTFWRFPKSFSAANPQGIRPISTYLKVIGDFCWWQEAPGGGSIVFGCDDQARNEFLGKRKLKAEQPKRARSESNLWFVKPEELKNFGPPAGEGWVWLGEDVKAGELSDPFLYAGYENMKIECNGRYELVKDGDWVRVKALEDIKGATAHFRYGPEGQQADYSKKEQQADYSKKEQQADYSKKGQQEIGGVIEIVDDNGKKWKFPNLNGDKTVICREVATERDLLYVGGMFYELPAENAGGFAGLRPIAPSKEPVRSIDARYGLVFINGRPMALDSLWHP